MDVVPCLKDCTPAHDYCASLAEFITQHDECFRDVVNATYYRRAISLDVASSTTAVSEFPYLDPGLDHLVLLDLTSL